MTLRARLLSRFTNWALSKNSQDKGYAGEDDPRWAYTIRGDDGSPYLTRVLLSRTRALKWFKDLTGFGIYLHHFHRPDGDQAMHSHPWNWGASLVLNGSYVEERVDQIVRIGEVPDREGDGRWIGFKVLTDTKVVRFWNYLTKDDFHAVRSLKGDTWTLFFTGERHGGDWGFLVDGVEIPWREYLLLNPASGDALDKIGKAYATQRKATMSVDMLTGLPGHFTWAEPDNEYRERIRAAMRLQATEELK